MLELDQPFFAHGDILFVSRRGPGPAGFSRVPCLEAQHLLRELGGRAAQLASRVRDFVDGVTLYRADRPTIAPDPVKQPADLVDLGSGDDVAPETDHWIEIRVLDEGYAPLSGEAITCTGPLGQVSSGATEDAGRFFTDAIGKAGPCAVTLPGLGQHLPEPLTLAADQIHTIIVPGLRLVHLCLVDFEARPVSGRQCVLSYQQADLVAITDAGGNVSFRMSTGPVEEAEPAQLRAETEVLGHGGPRPVLIAPLPPLGTPQGQRERLDNLGYIPVDAQPGDPPSAYAIEEFQCDHGLAVTGVCDGATQAKLAECHGH